MSGHQEIKPILLLHQLELKAKGVAHGLPQQQDIQTTWDAIGFRLLEQRLVVAMKDVREVLKLPPMTRIPGARPWVMGLANIRGNLMPILDLHGFLSNEAQGPKRRSRVLIVSHRGVTAGLMVDEVFGMRHFLPEEFSAQHVAAQGTVLDGYVTGSYRQTGEQWGVFDVYRLFDAPEFMKVAA